MPIKASFPLLALLVPLSGCTAATRVHLTPEQSRQVLGTKPSILVTPEGSPDEPPRELPLEVRSVEARLENGKTWIYPPTSLGSQPPWLTGPSAATEVTLIQRKPRACASATAAVVSLLGAGIGAVASYQALKPRRSDDGLEGMGLFLVPPIAFAASGVGFAIGTGIGQGLCSEDYEAVEIRDSGAPGFTPQVIPEPGSSAAPPK